MKLGLMLYVGLVSLVMLLTWPDPPVDQAPGRYIPYQVPEGYELVPAYTYVYTPEPPYVPNPHGAHDLLHEPCVSH